MRHLSPSWGHFGPSWGRSFVEFFTPFAPRPVKLGVGFSRNHQSTPWKIAIFADTDWQNLLLIGVETQERPSWGHLGPSWGQFGANSVPFWAISVSRCTPEAKISMSPWFLNDIKVTPGPLWGHSGPSWVHLGPCSGRLGAI